MNGLETKSLAVLCGTEDHDAEVRAIEVDVVDGQLRDACFCEPLKVEPAEHDIYGWGDIDGPAYDLTYPSGRVVKANRKDLDTLLGGAADWFQRRLATIFEVRLAATKHESKSELERKVIAAWICALYDLDHAIRGYDSQINAVAEIATSAHKQFRATGFVDSYTYRPFLEARERLEAAEKRAGELGNLVHAIDPALVAGMEG